MNGNFFIGIITAIEALLNVLLAILRLGIYQKKHQQVGQKLITIGRVSSLAILVIGAFWAPVVSRFNHTIYCFQECWAFIAIPNR